DGRAGQHRPGLRLRPQQAESARGLRQGHPRLSKRKSGARRLLQKGTRPQGFETVRPGARGVRDRREELSRNQRRAAREAGARSVEKAVTVLATLKGSRYVHTETFALRRRRRCTMRRRLEVGASREGKI